MASKNKNGKEKNVRDNGGRLNKDKSKEKDGNEKLSVMYQKKDLQTRDYKKQ